MLPRPHSRTLRRSLPALAAHLLSPLLQDADGKTQRCIVAIRCVRPIAKGEELTITYIGLYSHREERRADLQA